VKILAQADDAGIDIEPPCAAMNNSPTHHAPTRRVPPVGSVEWEELPALPHVVLRRHVPQASYAIASEMVREAQAKLREAPPVAPVWTETLPAIFDPLLPSAPLADTRINGLATREIMEPDVFRHFFGNGAVR
jgi:hypothetical protein